MIFAAGIEDFIQALIPIVFVVIWLVSQLAGGDKKAPPAPRQRRPNPPPPAQQQNPDLRKEIEAFLKQATQQPEPQRPARQAQQAQQTQQARSGERRPPERSSRPNRGKAPPPRPVEAVIVADEVRETVAEHVQHLTSTVGSHFEDDMVQASDSVHATFDREDALAGVGPAISDQQQDTFVSEGAQYARLLATPDGMRQAIIFNEILNRPNFD